MAKEKETGVQKMSKWDKIVAWYASQAVAVGMVYSIGASVVIIGALFKILHWPGASYVLMLGMFTEAFLFIIGIFEKPHPTYHWEHVYPNLIEEEAAAEGEAAHHEAPVHKAEAPAEGGVVPAFDGKDMEMFKKSIANMSTSASNLAELGKLAEGTNKLSDKLSAAADAADKFAGAQSVVSDAADKLGTNYVATAKVAESLRNDTEAAAKSQAAVAQSLAALNAAYEQNLKAVQSNAAEAQKMAEAGAAFAEAQDKLAKQLADLNKVYGNMLNALA